MVTYSFMDDKFTDNELYRDILLDRLHVNEGMLMENIVAQELRASGHKLYYSHSDTDKRGNNMEIDFLIRQKRKCDSFGLFIRMCGIENRLKAS